MEKNRLLPADAVLRGGRDVVEGADRNGSVASQGIFAEDGVYVVGGECGDGLQVVGYRTIDAAVEPVTADYE